MRVNSKRTQVRPVRATLPRKSVNRVDDDVTSKPPRDDRVGMILSSIGRLLAINRVPRSRHEPGFAAGKDVQCPLGISLLRLRRFQFGKVPKNFFLSAWRQIVPSLPRVRISVQFVAKPRWHWVGWATLVFMIKLNRKGYNITDACT
jgi:hypothetical protein